MTCQRAALEVGSWKNNAIEPDCGGGGGQRRLTSSAKQNICGNFGERKTLTVEELRLLRLLGEGEEDKPSRTNLVSHFRSSMTALGAEKLSRPSEDHTVLGRCLGFPESPVPIEEA